MITPEDRRDYLRKFSMENVDAEAKKTLPTQDLVTAESLADTPFPDCCERCVSGQYFGGCCCIDACPEKFEVSDK